MPTYAVAADVTDRWGQAITDEAILTLITTRLADAERMLKRRIKDLDAQIIAETIDVEDVKQVEADAVLRLARNPDGYISETDGAYTYMLAQNLSKGRLEILPEEWEILGVIFSTMSVLIPNIVIPT